MNASEADGVFRPQTKTNTYFRDHPLERKRERERERGVLEESLLLGVADK